MPDREKLREQFAQKHEKWLIGTDDDAEMAQEWVMENLPDLLALIAPQSVGEETPASERMNPTLTPDEQALAVEIIDAWEASGLAETAEERRAKVAAKTALSALTQRPDSAGLVADIEDLLRDDNLTSPFRQSGWVSDNVDFAEGFRKATDDCHAALKAALLKAGEGWRDGMPPEEPKNKPWFVHRDTWAHGKVAKYSSGAWWIDGNRYHPQGQIFDRHMEPPQPPSPLPDTGKET